MRKLTYRELSSFCEELAWLLHSGVSVGNGLALLAEEETEAEWKKQLSDMAEQSDGGVPLSQIIRETEIFPTYAKGIIGVGESTGRLEESLNALAVYYEERERMNRRVRSALLYPSILLLLMMVVMLVLLTQVLPIFESVFSSLGGTLDGVAGGLLKLGTWLNAGMPAVFAVMLLLLGFVIAFGSSLRFREWVLGIWKKIAGDKGVMRKLNDAGFAQAVSMGLRSGLTMEETLKLAAQVLEEVPDAVQRCNRCREELEQGNALADAFRNTDVLPAASCRLLSLGMQSGNGDVVMEEIAKRMSEEAEEALANKVAKVEPTLVLVTSVLVGAILLSVMLPLMNIMETIG